MTGTVSLHEIEDVGQRRDADIVGATLRREARGVGGARLEASDVVALQLREGERTDGRSLFFQEGAIRPACVLGIEIRVMADDENVVPGHGEVEFKRGDADFQRGLERQNCVFRREPAGAAMALQIESVSRKSHEGEHRDEHDLLHSVKLDVRCVSTVTRD